LSVERCKAAIEQANQGPSNVIGIQISTPKHTLTYRKAAIAAPLQFTI
jgi:hypothetical protein